MRHTRGYRRPAPRDIAACRRRRREEIRRYTDLEVTDALSRTLGLAPLSGAWLADHRAIQHEARTRGLTGNKGN